MRPGSVVFDRYRLEEQVGAGAMSVVWKATDALLDQPVALKRVSFALGDHEGAEFNRDRALREARIAARLRGHPQVVSLYDVRVADGDVWLVLEYLPSQSLAQLIKDRGRLEPGEVARIGARVADALAAGHAHGIEHRDVKPGNVLVGLDGTVKLTDFGISHLAGDPCLTQTGVLTGTVAYLAPEVAGGAESAPASDVFSLGATLYAAVESRPPFGTDNDAIRLLNTVRTGVLRPPVSAGPLAPLLLRLLAADPAARPDAATARDQLERLADGLGAATRPGIGAALPAPPRPPRRRRTAAVLGLLGAAAVVLGAVLAMVLAPGGRGGAPPPSAVGPPGGRPPPYPVGAPAVPGSVGPVALTGNPRAADPCALLDPAWLQQFGRPRIAVGSTPDGCLGRIARPGDDIRLYVFFDTPVSAVSDIEGTPQRLGELTIVRRGINKSDTFSECRAALVLADLTRVYINASSGAPADLCAVDEVGIATAVNALARHGISYDPGRTAGYSLGRADACATLGDSALATVPGLNPSAREPGFGNWSCDWGGTTAGDAHVVVEFQLDDSSLSADLGQPTSYGEPVVIGGRSGFLSSETGNLNPQRCTASVVHRRAPTPTSATELVAVTVDAPQPTAVLCGHATDLAAAAEAALPPA